MTTILSAPDYRQQLLLKAIRITSILRYHSTPLPVETLNKLKGLSIEWDDILNEYLISPSDQGVI